MVRDHRDWVWRGCKGRALPSAKGGEMAEPFTPYTTNQRHHDRAKPPTTRNHHSRRQKHIQQGTTADTKNTNATNRNERKQAPHYHHKDTTTTTTSTTTSTKHNRTRTSTTALQTAEAKLHTRPVHEWSETIGHGSGGSARAEPCLHPHGGEMAEPFTPFRIT